MAPKTQRKLTEEVWQGLYGVPGTDENGLLGDVKALVAHVAKQNGRIRRLEISLASLVFLLVGFGIIDASMTHVLIGG